MPPILFEGDSTPAPVVSGPGGRFVTGSPPVPVRPAIAGLPETYASGRIWITVTDPRQLLVQWDLAEERLRAAVKVGDGRLVLSVHRPGGKAGSGIKVVLSAAAKSSFVPLTHGGEFVAELGWYTAAGRWQTITASDVVVVPAERPAAPGQAEFATIPVDVPFATIFGKVKEVAEVSAPLIETIGQLRATGFDGLPDVGAATPPAWTPEQERALAEVLHVSPDRRVWVGSLDITELVRDTAAGGPPAPSSLSVAVAPEARGGLPPGAVSSLEAGGAVSRERGFWFNVNAELIVYGATEPDARLTVAGRAVKLRPDGSFALRFALPDGEYELPVVAVAADGTEARSARLEFRRATAYHGADAHPQDPGLKPPTGEHVEQAARS